jgi:uncharacterized membrane protein
MKKKSNQSDKERDQSNSLEKQKKDILVFLEKEFGIPKEALKNLDISKTNIEKISTYEYSFKGPFPHPELLRDYEDIKPGAVDTLFKYIDKNLNHRIEMDNHKVFVERNNIEMGREYFKLYKKLTLRGQLFSFFIALVDIGAAVTCAFLSQPVIGAAIIAPLVGILSYLAFLKPEKSGKQNIKDQKKNK